MTSTNAARETDTADIGIYNRLLEWAIWSTKRRHITERRDELAGDVRLTQDLIDRFEKTSRTWFPRHIEAIDKAVASLKVEHDDMMLYHLLSRYFLKWQTIEHIADAENLSEHHVINCLHRAMRLVARRLPFCEARVKV